MRAALQAATKTTTQRPQRPGASQLASCNAPSRSWTPLTASIIWRKSKSVRVSGELSHGPCSRHDTQAEPAELTEDGEEAAPPAARAVHCNWSVAPALLRMHFIPHCPLLVMIVLRCVRGSAGCEPDEGTRLEAQSVRTLGRVDRGTMCCCHCCDEIYAQDSWCPRRRTGGWRCVPLAAARACRPRRTRARPPRRRCGCR